MNTTNTKTLCRRPVMQPAGRRNRLGFDKACQRFLPAMAGALLLLASINSSRGGCIDDPCKFPSLAYPFEASPSFHHRHDDASGTFCAPCYAYRPTCWREWPNGCVGCPFPGGPLSPGLIGSANTATPATAPDQPTIPKPVSSPALPAPIAPVLPPPPEPQPAPPPATPAPQAVPAVTPPPAPLAPKSEPATVPAPPATAPAPSTEPPVLPPHKTASAELPEAPMPPETAATTPREMSASSRPLPGDGQDSGVAPMPRGLPVNVLPPPALLPKRTTKPREDLGVAPMPPSLRRVAQVPEPIDGVRKSSAELDLAPMPPELPRVARNPLAPVSTR
jgi:hypothetical protein